MSEMIRVTPSYLRKIEGELEQARLAVEQNFTGAAQSLLQIETCFCAEGVKRIGNNLVREQEAGEATLESLALQIQKLSVMADIYEEAERSNTDVTQTGK